jgi:hypothetical protein
MTDEPIRMQMAQVIKGKRGLNGNLLLYRDRVSHVGSVAMSNPYLGGVLGLLVTSKMAKKKAAEKEAAGGKWVTTIPLAQITEVRRGSKALQKNLLELALADGTAIMFGVKYEKWKDDLVTALTNAGRQVTDAGDVVTVR